MYAQAKSLIKKGFFRLFIIALLLGVLSGISFQLESVNQHDAEQNKQEVLLAGKGELMPFELNQSQPATIVVGTNSVIISPDNGSWIVPIGLRDNNFDLGLNPTGESIGFDYLPITVRVVNNALYVSTVVYNIEGQEVAYITDNVWKSDTSESLQIGDRNYNPYAFEVIDQNNVSLLNVEITGSNEIKIGGYFFLNGTHLVLSDNGASIGIFTKEDLVSILQPIFKYPSSNYLGELVNPIYLQNLPLDISNRLFLEAEVLTITGYILLGFKSVVCYYC